MFPTKLNQDEMQALMLTEPTNIPLMYIYTSVGFYNYW